MATTAGRPHVGLWALLCALGLHGSGLAQDTAPESPEEPGWKAELVSLPLIEQAQDQFDALMAWQAAVSTEADPNRREDMWRRIVRGFDDLLRTHGDHLYYFEDRKVYRPLSDLVLQQLTALPEEGRREYRRRHDDAARLLLNEAGMTGAESPLLRLVEEHPVADTAPQALRVLSERAFEQGDFERALPWCRRLISLHAQALEAADAPLLAKAGYAAWAIQDREFLAQLTGLAVQRFAAARVVFGARQEALVTLLRGFQATPAPAPDADREWRFPGGLIDGLSPARFVPVTAAPRWAVTLPRAFGREETRSAGWMGGRFFVGEDFSPVMPIVHRGTVFVSTGVTISAFNLYSGRMKWAHRVAFSSREYRFSERDPHEIFALCADEGLVFAGVEMPQLERPEVYAALYSVSLPRTMRTLTAFEGETGAVLWQRGGALDPHEDLRALSFNQAPVAVGGRVYAVGSERRVEDRLFLCAFERQSGRYLWRRYLCAGQQEVNMFGWPVREAFPSVPVVADGVLYVGSNLGAVFAFDLRREQLLWAATYPVMPVREASTFTPVLRETAWANNPPVISGRRVMFTPTDSELALAFDRHSGELAWRLPRRFLWRHFPDAPESGVWSDFTRMAPAGEGRIVLGGAFLAQVNADSGQREWVARLPGQLPVAGAMVAAGAVLFCPTASGVVATLDLEQPQAPGKTFSWGALATEDAGRRGPNLIAVDHMLVAATTQGVAAWYDAERLLLQANAALARQPQDPNAHLQVADLAFQQGRFQDARAGFERAMTMADAQPMRWGPAVRRRARQGLSALARQEARDAEAAALAAAGDQQAKLLERALSHYERALAVTEDDDQALELWQRQVELFARLITLKPQREDDFLALIARLGVGSRHRRATFEGFGEIKAGLYAEILQARHLEKRRRFTEAIARYQTVIADFPFDRVGEFESGARFARAQIARILDGQGRDPYTPFEDQARAALRQAVATDSVAGLRFVIARFPNALCVDDAVATLAEHWQSHDQPRAAVGTLGEYLREFPEGRRRIAMARRLYDGYRRLGADAAASRVLDWIEHSRLSAPVDDHPEGAPSLDEWLAGQRRDLDRDEPAKGRRWRPALDPPTGKLWERGDDGTNFLALWSPRGRRPPGLPALMFQTVEATLEARDARTGELRWQNHQYTGIRAIEYVGTRLLLVAQQRVGLVDADNGQERWGRDLAGADLRHATADGGLLALLIAGGEGLPSAAFAFRLALFDVHSGEPLWEIPLPGRQFTEAPLIGARTVYQTCRLPGYLKAFDLVTGRERFHHEFGELNLTAAPLLGDQDAVTLISNVARVQVLAAQDGRVLVNREYAPGALRRAVMRGTMLTLWLVERESGHRLIALDCPNDSVIWETTLSPQFQVECLDLAHEEEGLFVQWRDYVAPGAAAIALFDPATGRPRWKQDLPWSANLRPFPPRWTRDALVFVDIETETEQRLDASGQPLVVARHRVHLSLRRLADGRHSYHTTIECDQYPGFNPSEAPFVDGVVVLGCGNRLIAFGAPK